MLSRSLLLCSVMAALVGSTLVGGQGQRPLSPVPSAGNRVAPFFDGWYANPDGTITFSFGYSNLNSGQVEIPVGPDNFIEPKAYDGRQPTSFSPDVPNGDAGGGARADRRGRERGVFTVTVPAGFQDTVVWTLQSGGQTYKVPGTSKSSAYQLQWPMAMGSIPPLLRFSPDGPPGRGPAGIESGSLRISVGVPLAVTIWVSDDSQREEDPVVIKQRLSLPAINVTWFKHSGPGPVSFSKPKEAIGTLNGSASTSVLFSQPGDYVIRVRADNFGRVDTNPGNQCCWTNGYVRVSVTP
jgi:hypothetical protein